MQGWKGYKLNELGKVGRGKSKHRPRNDVSLYGGKYPFVQTGDVKAANFYITKFSQTYNEKGLAQSKLWKPGTLCITIAANIAESAILGIDACFPDSIIGFVPDGKKSDVRFIKYHFDLLKLHLQSISQGTTQDNLSQEKLLKFIFTVPEDLAYQKHIASIISAYDELIEVNNERIKLLKETASELYKEWFVRMRFPGYKKVKFVKGVPTGWEMKKLSELVSTQYGYTASATYESVGPKFLRITDIADLKIDWEKVPNCLISERDQRKYLLQNGDIVVARTGATVGFAKRINKFHQPTVFASYLVRLKPKSCIYNYYLGIIAESEGYKEYVQSIASGAAQPQANAVLMTGLLLFKPTDSLLELFNSIVEPMFDQEEILEKQITQLRQIRDRLLPRLINGELKVGIQNIITH